MALEPLTRVHCTNCGSENVLADANVSWNVQLQDWEIEQVWEKGGYCPTCETYDARWEHRPFEEEVDGTIATDSGAADTGRAGNVDVHDQLGSIRDREHKIR